MPAISPALALLSLLAACGGCTDKEKADKADPTAEPAAPGPGALTRDGVVEKPRKKLAPIPAATDAVTDGSTAAAFVLVEGNAIFLSKDRQATLNMPADTSYWTGTTVERSQGEGMRVYTVIDTGWWRPGGPSDGARTLKDVLTEKGTVDEWVLTDSIGNGSRKRVFVNLDGRRDRLGIFSAAPTASIFLEVETPARSGKPAAALGKASGFQKAEDGSWAHAAPTDATAIPAKAGDSKAWSTDLAKQRGAAVTVRWSQVLDLDQDGADEAVLCVDGGKADSDCYVFDEVGGERRYYGLAGMRMGSATPLAFSLNGTPYLVHSPATGSAPASIPGIVRWNGLGYVYESI